MSINHVSRVDDCRSVKGHPQPLSPRVLSIQVGPAKTYDTGGGSLTTALVKTPVEGRIWLGRTGLVNDVQANRRYHGGPEQAVLCYAADHYPLWRAELQMPQIPFGGFGENFTLAEVDESSVCIGDTYRAGEAVVQVSQPREPCMTLTRYWGVSALHTEALHKGRTGWYLRVLQEGDVDSGVVMKLIERPCPQWTVAATTQVMFFRRDDTATTEELAANRFLSPKWRGRLARRLGIAVT